MNINVVTLEDLVLKIATKLINIPVSEFDERIQESLEMIGNFLDVDRVYVFDYDLKNYLTSNTFEWCREGVTPQIEYLQNVSISELSDDWVKAHINGEMMVYEDVMSLDKSSRVYEILAPQGILSICTVPLTYENNCFGFVGFDDIRHQRKWIDQDFILLKVLAEMLINAIIKRKSDSLLNELREKAQKASEAKSIFLAQMSHEIRTPLNGVYNAFYLLTQIISTDDYRSYIDIAQTSLDSLSSIVNNILDLSKIEAKKMSVNLDQVDLEHEIVKTLKTIRPSIKSKELSCFYDYDFSIDKKVFVDMRKVNQIILNLINNAVKFTDYGFIKTTISKVFLDDQFHLLLSIEDSGIGMSDEDKSHILESFYQAKTSNRQGTGLGLSIINELVLLMNGKIEISSTLGVGSKFNVYLPYIEGDNLNYTYTNKKILLIGKRTKEIKKLSSLFQSFGSKISIGLPLQKEVFDLIVFENEFLDSDVVDSIYKEYLHENSVKILVSDNMNKNTSVDITFDYPVSRKMFESELIKLSNKDSKNSNSKITFKGNVLIVDDNEINRDVLSAILNMHGVNSVIASSGLQAIELSKIQKFDLIFMDIQMPHMNGYEASKIIKSGDLNSSTPIVVLTANVFLNTDDVKESRNFHSILFKPIQMDQFLNLLETVLTKITDFSIPKNLMIFNKESCDILFEDSGEAKKVFINSFIDNYKNDISNIKKVVNSSDYQYLYEKLHYIKGTLSYLSAERLLYLIDHLMLDSKSKIAVSNDKLNLFEKEYELLVNEIKNSNLE
jgi:signal transduction histidine kinase/CheY-like chemotaxis protein